MQYKSHPFSTLESCGGEGFSFTAPCSKAFVADLNKIADCCVYFGGGTVSGNVVIVFSALMLLFMVSNSAAVPIVEFVEPTPPEGSAINGPALVKAITTDDLDVYSFFSDGVVAWYTFNDIIDNGGGNLLLHDGSFSGNDGSVQNAAIADGRFGNSYSFNGSEGKVAVPDSGSLPAAQLTVSVWINPSSLQDGAPVIVRSGSPTYADGYGIAYYSLNGAETLNFFVDGLAHAASAPLQAGKWTHVVGTYDGSIINLYIDGALAAQADYSNVPAASASGLAIGSNSDGSRVWDGRIDDAVILNSAIGAGDAAALFDSNNKALERLVTALGANTISVVAFDGASGTAFASRNFTLGTSGDTQPPVITVLGANPASVMQGSVYADAGSSALDNEDGDLTTAITVTSDVNTAAEGTYSVIYSVADLSGNSASASRVVNVVRTADNMPPMITLVGPALVNVHLGSAYADPGATAADNVDGNITGRIVAVNPVDTNTLGTYIVTYDANDVAGNAAEQAARTVNVVDQNADVMPPQIIDVAVRNISSSDVNVSWRTNEPSEGEIEYGANGTYVRVAASSTAASTVHAVLISGLSPDTDYDLKIKSRDIAKNEVVINSGPFRITPDANSPVLLSHSPANNATGVALDTEMFMLFSEPLDASTVGVQTVQLRRYGDDSIVPTTVQLAEGDRKVVLTANAGRLDPGTNYFFTISNAIRDIAGNSGNFGATLSDKASHQFTTIAIPVPAPASPPDNAQVTGGGGGGKIRRGK